MFLGDDLSESYEDWVFWPLALKADHKTYFDIIESYGLQQVTNRIMAVKEVINDLIKESDWKIISVDDRYILEVTEL